MGGTFLVAPYAPAVNIETIKVKQIRFTI